ncbi:hypothetical protein GLYMA_10G131900v4 [Glycine max]|nr:hypothetical protein GLYMA_10G131900v4 [Glycine max]KAH1138037.1 hypothetical protein GYH30_027869 [Glycine max]
MLISFVFLRGRLILLYAVWNPRKCLMLNSQLEFHS